MNARIRPAFASQPARGHGAEQRRAEECAETAELRDQAVAQSHARRAICQKRYRRKHCGDTTTPLANRMIAAAPIPRSSHPPLRNSAAAAAAGMIRLHRLSARSPAPCRISQPARGCRARWPATPARWRRRQQPGRRRTSTRNVGSSAITTTPIRPMQLKAAASANRADAGQRHAVGPARPAALRRNRQHHERHHERRQHAEQAQPTAPSDGGGERAGRCADRQTDRDEGPQSARALA